MGTTEWEKLSSEAQKGIENFLTENVEDLFKVLEDDGRYFRSLIFGEPGCGKTVLAAHLARPEEKILFFDFENSTEVLADHAEELNGRVDVIRKFPGINELRFSLKLIEQQGKYKTVVFDSITSMQTKEMRSILNFSGHVRAKGEGGEEGFTKQDFGLYLNRLNWLLDTILETKLNVIMIGHVKELSDLQITNGAKRRMLGSDNQIAAITTRLGNIFFMEEGEDSNGNRKRIIRTRTDGTVQVKTRINSLPDTISAPKFIEAIQEWRKFNGN